MESEGEGEIMRKDYVWKGRENTSNPDTVISEEKNRSIPQ